MWHGSGSDGEIGTLHSELPANAASASTAISFFPSNYRDTLHLMIGLETGGLMVWKLGEGLQWTKCADIAPYFAHTLQVKRISFNSRFSDFENGKYTVATCAGDQTVRIFRIQL